MSVYAESLAINLGSGRRFLLPRGFGFEATEVWSLSHVVRAWARPHVMLVRMLRCVSSHGDHSNVTETGVFWLVIFW